MKRLFLLGAVLLAGCKGGAISDLGMHYCDMTSVSEVIQEDGDHKNEGPRKTEKIAVAYLNIVPKKRFAFTYQLDGLWHTDPELRYEVIGGNLIGNNLTEEPDPLDNSLTIERSLALSVNTDSGETTRTLTKKHLDKDKSVVTEEIRTINGICSFDSQAI